MKIKLFYFDAINVVNEVKCCCFDSIFGALIEDVELLGLVGGGICCHISCQSNMVAYSLATMGMNSLGTLVGDRNVFPSVYDALKTDLV